MKKYLVLALSLALGLMGILVAGLADDSHPTYESYYLYLGNYPKDRENGWSDEIQGVANDHNNWFFTQAKKLWKFPVEHDLNTYVSSPPDPPIYYTKIEDIPELSGYNHFGDLDYYEYEGNGFLFVPVEGGPPAVIAVFSAGDLQYIDKAEVDPGQEDHAPWCAVYPDDVDPDGFIYLYSSKYDNVGGFYRYRIDWAKLRDNNQLVMEKVAIFSIFDEQGNSLILQHIQGGVFSESGNLLYIVNGNHEDTGCDCGIHVFNTQTHRRVAKSSKSSMPFKYEFHPGWSKYEEPEGITIWDLDDGRAPHIRGQLHVIMLDNDAATDDDLYFKHYSHTIHVDGSYSGEEEGTPTKPFNTVGEAHDYAWDGAQIKIQAGSYPETLMFSKRLTILAAGGTVTIGQ